MTSDRENSVSQTPKVSIIMRSMNDIGFIEQTLKMVFSQEFTDFELLNVDSGSTDGTYDIVKKYNPGNSYQIPPGSYVPGKVLNEAIAKTKGEIIVFNNSDCIPQDNQWLGNLVKPLLEESEVIATYGNQLPRPDANPLIVKDNVRAFGDGKIAATWFHFFSLATSAIRRKTILEFPFDPELQYSEDVDWSYRMKKKGLVIKYVPDAVVEHSHNYTLPQVKKRFYNEGYAEGRIYGTSPGFLWNFLKPLMVEICRDLLYLSKKGKLPCIPGGLVYRFLQRYSAYKGRRDYFRKIKKL